MLGCLLLSRVLQGHHFPEIRDGRWVFGFRHGIYFVKFVGHFPLINSQEISTRFFCAELPKGPYHAKDTIATQSTMNYCAVVFSLHPPDMFRPGRFLQRKSACQSMKLVSAQG